MDATSMGHYAVLSQATQADAAATDSSYLGMYQDVGVNSTPRVVAGLVLAAIITIALLKWAGFRFSFGVGVGGN